MTIANWLINSMVKLQKAGVPSGRRDALILVADVMEKDRAWVHTHPEHNLTENQLRQLNYRVKRRAQRIPLAYIRGFQEFYGRPFKVSTHVLVPRPESESFIALLREIDMEMPWIADVGCGSGCLGITAALEYPEATVHMYDISPDALRISRVNARRLDAQVRCYQSNLLSSYKKTITYDVVMANLPYVPEDLVTSPEITKEPAIALFSGRDGMNLYREFWKQVGELKNKPKCILTESLKDQHAVMRGLAKNAGYRLVDSEVLVQMYCRV